MDLIGIVKEIIKTLINLKIKHDLLCLVNIHILITKNLHIIYLNTTTKNLYIYCSLMFDTFNTITILNNICFYGYNIRSPYTLLKRTFTLFFNLFLSSHSFCSFQRNVENTKILVNPKLETALTLTKSTLTERVVFTTPVCSFYQTS